MEFESDLVSAPSRMTHFGMFCPPATGHLDPVGALGRELQARGHRVTVFQVADVEKKVRGELLDFCPVGKEAYPIGSLPEYLEELGRQEGWAGVRYSIECGGRLAELMCRELPTAIKKAGIDVILVDQNEPAAGTVAEHLGIPFITLCTSLPLNREASIPPPFTLWPYSTNVLSRARNTLAYLLLDRLLIPITRVLNDYRRRWHLAPLKGPDDSFSERSQLAQMIEDFDFPKRSRIPNFYYLGPFCTESRQSVPFPWERLDGRPLLYASLGTLQNRQAYVFRAIAEACAPLQVQLVLSFGHKDFMGLDLPGRPIMVDYAPQLELLAKAHAVITHAGTNTAMGALRYGLPMVAIPITNDQPGTAARLQRTGAGEAIELSQLTSKRLKYALERILTQPSYRQEAQRLRGSIERAGGVRKAADIIESHATRQN